MKNLKQPPVYKVILTVIFFSFVVSIGITMATPLMPRGALGSYSNPLPAEQLNGYEVRVLEARWDETPIKMKLAGHFGQIWVTFPENVCWVTQQVLRQYHGRLVLQVAGQARLCGETLHNVWYEEIYGVMSVSENGYVVNFSPTDYYAP